MLAIALILGMIVISSGTLFAWGYFSGQNKAPINIGYSNPVVEDVVSGFTVGSVMFASSSGALNQDNASFYWNDTLNYFGVGTSTPQGRLHVASADVGTTTMWVGDLTGVKGQICLGDADGSGGTCFFGIDGVLTAYATGTY